MGSFAFEMDGYNANEVYFLAASFTYECVGNVVLHCFRSPQYIT